MNARIMMTAVVLAGMLTGGCGQQSSTPKAETMPPEFRSSRLILISRQTGEVLYDGSAHDEG
jgi:D-alanyl-D-alanine carboxypeptidase